MLALELDPVADQAPCNVTLASSCCNMVGFGKSDNRNQLNFCLVQLLSVLSGWRRVGWKPDMTTLAFRLQAGPATSSLRGAQPLLV